MKNMKIGPKLILSFLIVAIISSIGGILSDVILRVSDKQYSNALINYGFSQGDIGLLMSTINENCTSLVTTMATEDASFVQEATQRIYDNVSKINQYTAAIEPTLVSDDEKNAFEIIKENLPQFTEHAEKVLALAGQNKNKEAFAEYQNEAKEHIDNLQAAAQKLMDINKTEGGRLSTELTHNSVIMVWGVIAIIVAAFVISALIAVRVSRGIARPMGACSERLVGLSKGDLTSPVPQVDSKDETGVLAAATDELVNKLNNVVSDMTGILKEMADGNLNVVHENEYNGDFAPLHTSTVQIIQSLNDTLAQINQSSDQVASGSDQVSAGAQALSQGATEQASSVEELAATINEISNQVRSNAENASQASTLAQTVGGQMTESNRQMEDMINAMEEISASSSEIGKIIKTIEDIAFQTNILALNAAVEAARAGAAGKGFAVVADEVRNLANKSQEASKNTASLIESSLKAVENGTQIAGETAKSLLAAVEGAKKVTGTVDRISEASKTQAEAVMQVTTGIDQISSVVQTNSATAEQSAAASEELSGQAQMLKDLVGRFRLRGMAEYTASAQEQTADDARADDFGTDKY